MAIVTDAQCGDVHFDIVSLEQNWYFIHPFKKPFHEAISLNFFFFFLEPSKGPTVWRTIDASPSPAFWTVRLMWKVKQCAKLQKLNIIF